MTKTGVSVLAIALVTGFASFLAGCSGHVPSTNAAPVAEAGPDRRVVAGFAVTLDGSLCSDQDGDPLSYHWSLAQVPEGSNASLSDPTIANPVFTPDAEEAYVITLILSDGITESITDTVTVAAIPIDKAIVGTWRLVGIGGGESGYERMLLPESMTVVFTEEGEARWYVGGKLCRSSSYRTGVDKTIFSQDPLPVVHLLADGFQYAYSFPDSDTLILNENAYDGFQYEYRRA